MDINTKDSSGMMNGMPPSVKNDKKVGPIIGVLVIVLILIIIALYFFGQRLNTQAPIDTQVTTSTTSESNNVIRNEASLSSSTDVQSIQNDLDAQLKDVDYSF